MEDAIAIFDPPKPMFEEGGGLPVIAWDLPVVYEDEGQEELGESAAHTSATAILQYGIAAHMADRPQYRVFSNLNVLYHPIRRKAYISPDVMIVEPAVKLRDNVASYRIGRDGPAPKTTVEVLSKRTGQQGDLTFKPEICAAVGIEEYILVDPVGRLLPQRLQIRRLQPDGTYTEEQDEDGGITSHFGFRIILDFDDRVRVIDSASGERYARPEEAQIESRARAKAERAQRRAEKAHKREEEARKREEEARKREEEARRTAEKRNQELEAEIARLKKVASPRKKA